MSSWYQVDVNSLAVILAIAVTASLTTPEFAQAKAPAHAKSSAPSKPPKQIYELSQREERSGCLNASGVAAYVVSASGTNRGLLLRRVEPGFAAGMGMQPGDVLLSVNNRVIQTGADADRVLESTPSGPGRVVFVHPGESGLQLYNAQVNLPTFTNSHTALATSTGFAGANANNRFGGISTESLPALEQYMVELINHDRSANGSSPISENSALTALARAHARDMASRNFFNHVNPDGANPQTRAQNAGIKGGVFENIAYQSSSDSPQHQVKASEDIMMNEPKNEQNHRSNILDPNHASVGVGMARSSNGKLYMVQEFSHERP